MDQKSGKQPVNVHSETEEAENEMKKKTSKTVKSIAAVGFAVGGISAVQNFDAYAEDNGTSELDEEDLGGSDSEAPAEDNQGESGDGEQEESGGYENEETSNTDTLDDTNDQNDGQQDQNTPNDQQNGDDQQTDVTNESPDEAISEVSTPAEESAPAESTPTENASTEGTDADTTPTDQATETAEASTETEEVTGPVTTVTTETTSKDSFNEDGTTTTTTTVTTTTEKSDGTVTSDTQTSTKTKETTYQEVSEKDAVGPGVQEKYYKSKEGSDTADQEIEKDEYDKLLNTIDSNGKAKVAETEYYYMKDGQEVPCTAADYKAGDVISGTTYYKPTADGGKEEISKDEYDRIMSEENGQVEVEKKYYYIDEKGERQETDEAHYQAGKVELDSYKITYKDGTTASTDKETYEKAQQNGGTIDVENGATYTYTDAEGKTVTTDEATYNANNDHKVTIYYKEDSAGKKTAITKEEYDAEMADGNATKVTKTEYFYVDETTGKTVTVDSDAPVVVGHHYYKVIDGKETKELTEEEYNAALKDVVDGKIQEPSTYYYRDAEGNKQTEYKAADGTMKTVTEDDYNKENHTIVTDTEYYYVKDGVKTTIQKEDYNKIVDGQITVTETKYFYTDKDGNRHDLPGDPGSATVEQGYYKYYKKNPDGTETEITENGENTYNNAEKIENSDDRRIVDSVSYYYFDENNKQTLSSEEATKIVEIEGKKVYYTYYKVEGDKHVPIEEGLYNQAVDNKLKIGEEYYYIGLDNKEHASSKEAYGKDGKDKILLSTEYYYENADGSHHVISESEYNDAVNYHDKKIYETKYYVDDHGTKIYVKADENTKTLTPVKKADGNYYITDENGNEVKLSSGIVTETEHALGWYLDVTTADGGRKTVQVDSDAKIDLQNDNDGKGYYFTRDNEKLYVDPSQIQTSTSYKTDLTLINKDKTNDEIAKDKAMDFLNATGTATNFLVYADQFDMAAHIDGNVCVNEMTNSSGEGIYASGHVTLDGLDKYSIILNEKNTVNIGDINNDAVIIGTNKVNISGNLNGSSKYINIEDEKNGAEGATVQDKAIDYLLDHVEKTDKNRLQEEINIKGNLDKIAAAGQSLINYVSSKGDVTGSAVKALNSFNKIKNNEMLMLNITAKELSESDEFTNKLQNLITSNKDQTASRVIINVVTNNESKIDVWKVMNGNGAYNPFSSSILWNFGEYDGELDFHFHSEGTLIAAKAKVTLDDVRDGSVVADHLVHGGKEIHQSHIAHLPVTKSETAKASPLYKYSSSASVNVASEAVSHEVKKQENFTNILKRDITVDVGKDSHNVNVDETYITITRKFIPYTVQHENSETQYNVEKNESMITVEKEDHTSTVHDDVKTITPTKVESTETVYKVTTDVNKTVLYDKATVSRDTAKVEMESRKVDVTYEDHHATPQMREHLVSLAKKFFKPVLTESYDKKVEKIPETPDKPETPPETPDKPETPDTPHDDHDTPDTPHDDHDTPDTPKELHDKPDTPEVLGASRPKEQEVLGASRPKVLGVTRAAKTGDARNMARNGFAAAAGAVILAVWGTIKSLIGRKRRK